MSDAAKTYYETTAVNVSYTDRRQIYLEMGYPAVPMEELEIPPAEVDELVFKPALMDYFAYFPIRTVQEEQVTGDFSVAFPHANTMGVVDARVIPFSGLANVPTLSPFMNERSYYSAQSGGVYGAGQYDFEMIEAKLLNRRYIQASQNLLITKRIVVDRKLRVLKGTANAPYVLRITWADYSLDMDDVDYMRRRDIIKLCKANLLRAIAIIRSQQDSNSGMPFNVDALNTRAEKLELESIERWRKFAMPVSIRG